MDLRLGIVLPPTPAGNRTQDLQSPLTEMTPAQTGQAHGSGGGRGHISLRNSHEEKKEISNSQRDPMCSYTRVTHTYIYIYIYTYTYICVQWYMYIYIYTYACVQTPQKKHKQTNKQTHAHICVKWQSKWIQTSHAPKQVHACTRRYTGTSA